MANTLLTINMITREAVRLWKNTNAFIQHIDQQYDDSFAKTGAKIGQQLRIRLPNDYTVRTGPAAQVQDTTETSTTLVLATQAGVDVSFSTVDRTMSLDDYSKRVLAPMVNNLAGKVASDVMGSIDVQGGISNIVSNLDGSGAVITPVAETWLTGGAILDLKSAPTENRKVIADPITMARTVSSLAGLFNPAPSISQQYKSGKMGQALGFDWYSDQTVLKHINGSYNGAATVAGANQTGTQITVSAITGTINAGDILTFDNGDNTGVYSVNRITKQSDSTLAQFVATAAVANGGTLINIYPALIPASSGNPVQYQTVNVSPNNGAAVAFSVYQGAASSTYRKNFVFAPEAVTLATADLELPEKGIVEGAREAYDGISMRMITAYNIATDQLITRLDVLYGYLWVRPEWACAVGDAV